MMYFLLCPWQGCIITVYTVKDTWLRAHQEVVEVIRSQISFGVSWQVFIPVSSHVSRCVLKPNTSHSVGRCHTPVRNLIGATSWSGSLINREQTSHQLTAVLDTDVISSLPEPPPPSLMVSVLWWKASFVPSWKKNVFVYSSDLRDQHPVIPQCRVINSCAWSVWTKLTDLFMRRSAESLWWGRRKF